MVSGGQIRAARAFLAISSRELAELSRVGWATIRRYEISDNVPESRGGTLERIKAALEAEGIEFLGDPITSPGVRLNRKAG
jgi:DNA-binding transcriptional regulator YiaG